MSGVLGSSNRRVAWRIILGTAPTLILSIAAIGIGLRPYASTVWIGGIAFVVILYWVYSTARIWYAITEPLHVLANGLAAIRQHEYGVRFRGGSPVDALGLVFAEANLLADSLDQQRLAATEAAALVTTVLEEIDVAVFALDEANTVKFVNRRAEMILRCAACDLVGRHIDELGLGFCLEGPADRTASMPFDHGHGRWRVRRSPFRQGGRSHELVTITDVRLALHAEERLAWQRIVRVLGHEINNSLAPIRSIAETLRGILYVEPKPVEWETDTRDGLAVIQDRATRLSRFLSAYAILARLPSPELSLVRIGDVMVHVAGLERRLPIVLEGDPRTAILVDRDQIEQLLINLVRNAVDASLASGEAVTIVWQTSDSDLEITILDSGSGLPADANLFVPFFTTKSTGSGIGLPLSRQIAESHGGSVTLTRRARGCGTAARVLLPASVRPTESSSALTPRRPL